MSGVLRSVRRATLVIALTVAALVTPTHASAGPTGTCSFNARKARLDITTVGTESLYLNGQYIELNTDSTCRRATVFNTDTIVVTADDSADVHFRPPRAGRDERGA